METNGKQRRLHYAWVIFGVCTIAFTMTTGILMNTQGLYFQPVSTDLGVPLSAFNLQSFFFGTGGAIALPFVTRVTQRVNVRVLYSVLLAIFCGTYFCMRWFTAVWMWYIAMFILGLASAFVGYAMVPYLINRWFVTKRSTIIGIATAISACAGIFVSLVGSHIIKEYGWRMGYTVFGAVTALCSVPVMAIFARRDPQEMGLRPYGEDENSPAAQVHTVYEVKVRLYPGEGKIFACVVAVSILGAMSQSFVHHLASFAATMGLPAMIGGSLISCAFAGNMGGKLVLGFLNERFGVKRMYLATMSLLMLAMLLFVFASSHLWLLYVGAVLSGLAMPLNVLQFPLLLWDFFDRQRYSAIYNIASMGAVFMTASTSAIIGWLVSATGAYRLSHTLGFLSLAAAMAFLLLLYRMRRNMPATEVQPVEVPARATDA